MEGALAAFAFGDLGFPACRGRKGAEKNESVTGRDTNHIDSKYTLPPI